MKKLLLISYKNKQELIQKRLNEFSSLSREKQFDEFIFCLLTPQSNAKKCWEAVEQLKLLEKWNTQNIIEILKTKTRFHNNKAKYLLKANRSFSIISPSLKDNNNKNIKELRNFIADNVKGYGLKESSHFLRNIGKSHNQIAILDRHILKNLLKLNIITQKDTKIKNKVHYQEIEQKFLSFSKSIGIPLDSLDLLFWSNENGEVFK
ncbi:MAG: DNA lyase [Nanoarchaeota archaeon]